MKVNLVVITDHSKAFDCIDYELLIVKMHAYGFGIESWVRSHGRKKAEHKNKLIL